MCIRMAQASGTPLELRQRTDEIQAHHRSYGGTCRTVTTSKASYGVWHISTEQSLDSLLRFQTDTADEVRCTFSFTSGCAAEKTI